MKSKSEVILGHLFVKERWPRDDLLLHQLIIIRKCYCGDVCVITNNEAWGSFLLTLYKVLNMRGMFQSEQYSLLS